MAKHTAKDSVNRSEGDLRRLQLVEYDLMCRFSDLCARQGYRYFLLGGTLLGAVRHKGFIPWDDDIDVGMPRSDYKRFLSYVGEHPESLRRPGDEHRVSLVSLYSDSAYRQGMAKITSDEMQVIDRSANVEIKEDVWIDIIPMDGFPSGGLASFAHKARLLFWKVMNATAQFNYAVNAKRDRGMLGNLAFKCLAGFCRVVRPFGDDYHRVLVHTENALERYAYDESDCVINLSAASGFREIWRRDDMGEGQAVFFEDRCFNAPDDIHAVLERIYGSNYMTPPPEDDRNWHNLEIIN